MSAGRSGELRSDFDPGKGTIEVTLRPEALGYYLRMMLPPYPQFYEARGTFNITSLQMPSHDPPVAWEVTDHALARLGFPVIACPAYRHPEPVVAGAATYMDPQPLILEGEPGRRP